MRRAMWLGRDRWVVIGITAYVVVAAAGLVALVMWSVPAQARDAVLDALGPQAIPAALAGALLVAGLVVLLAKQVGGTSASARRMAAETRVITDVDPDRRLGAPASDGLRSLAGAINDLADRRRAAEVDVADQVDAARRDLEADRNRLAALMAQLTVAVLVCNVEGRILLYNGVARSMLGDQAPIGLGRSVFGVVDRALVTHALGRIASGAEPVQTATTLHDERLLQVRLAAVYTGDDTDPGEVSGFVVVLDDLTRRVRASSRRERLLRELTEGTRAGLGSIRAAVESILDYPDLSASERARFLEIARQEADHLGNRLAAWADESARHAGEDRVLTDIAAEDLVAVLARALENEGLTVKSVAPSTVSWIRADSNAVTQAVVLLAGRVRGTAGVAEVALSLDVVGRHGRLDLRWAGQPPDAVSFAGWLEAPLEGGGAPSVRAVADRHGAEVWCGAGDDGVAYVRMLLPLADDVAARRPPTEPPARRVSRPEFYDFDLFETPPVSADHEDWLDRPLDQLAFTVFDTETTGLDPVGDRVVSIGAFRVVNARMLRQETFERLIDPQRRVPAVSTAIHGIASDMVRGQPTIEQVLPVFARFAEDTVLVGHNVSFDLRFLAAAGDASGVHLDQPVLDTLLLDGVLHPDHDEHSLEAIAGRLGVSVVGRHTALGDALVTGEVFIRQLALLRGQGIRTLREALTAARSTYQARLDRKHYPTPPSSPSS